MVKIRKLIRYSVGESGEMNKLFRQPIIRTEEVLQSFDDEAQKWVDVPTVHDHQSLEKAQRDKYRRK